VEGAPDATDWKAEASKWERRSRENADKAKAHDELQEQSKSELQRPRPTPSPKRSEPMRKPSSTSCTRASLQRPHTIIDC
jgi:hypothetical protein